MYLLLCQSFPQLAQREVISVLVPKRSGDTGMHITPAFVAGFTLATSGALLRWWCYQILGPDYTFVLTIRKNHALKTTGPYTIVRHPGYAAGILYGLSSSLCHFGEGSWWQESGMSETTSGRVVGLAFLVWSCTLFGSALRRIQIEDDVLKHVFGEQWEAWAKKTPYAVLPYVY